MSSCSSVDRAPAQCPGGHGFNSCQRLRFFLCPTLVSCWSIHFSHYITELKNLPSLFTLSLFQHVEINALSMYSVTLIAWACCTLGVKMQFQMTIGAWLHCFELLSFLCCINHLWGGMTTTETRKTKATNLSKEIKPQTTNHLHPNCIEVHKEHCMLRY